MRPQNKAARRVAPGAAVTNTVGAASTAAIDLTAYKGMILSFQAQLGAVSFRFGNEDVGAAVITDYTLASGEREEFEITSDKLYLRAIADGAARNLSFVATGV